MGDTNRNQSPEATADSATAMPALKAEKGHGAATDDALGITVELLARARNGDACAVERLFERCTPGLRRWATGRLPHYARDLADTQDLVQEALIGTLHRLNTFESRHQGALQAYLRRAVVNRIRDQVRRFARRPVVTELDDNQHVDRTPSPLEQAIRRKNFERCEAALRKLRPSDRAAIVARLHLQQTYEEIAVTLGKPSAAAARVAVARAMVKLVRELDLSRSGPRSRAGAEIAPTTAA